MKEVDFALLSSVQSCHLGGRSEFLNAPLFRLKGE